MTKNRKIILAKPFEGEPTPANFELLEEEIPPLKDGEVLVEARWWSIDPYMRVYMPRYPPRSVMVGYQVAVVLESKNLRYRRGKYVVGHFGWQTHTIFNDSTAFPIFPNVGMYIRPYVLPDIGALSPSLAIGTLGMPGNTAFFSVQEILKPKAGETFVVSGAAGAVGSLVGQIGKIKGTTVIGIAGSDEKCKWLTEELGYDFAINYKTGDVAEDLRKVAPNGVDLYFDNVGGDISDIVMNQMNEFGRIAVCGSISAYNDDILNADAMPRHPDLAKLFNFKQLRMEGFIVWRWVDRWLEGVSQLTEWVQQGKLKHQETVTKGFENLPQAFIGMLSGANTGKAVVSAA